MIGRANFETPKSFFQTIFKKECFFAPAGNAQARKQLEDKAKMTELYVTKMQEMEAKIKALESKKNEPDPRQLEEMKRLKT